MVGGSPDNYKALYAKSADNEILYILLNQGAVGLFGIILIYIYAVYSFARNSRVILYALLPIFTVICFLIIGATNTTIINIRMGLFFFMICGIAYAQKRQY